MADPHWQEGQRRGRVEGQVGRSEDGETWEVGKSKSGKHIFSAKWETDHLLGWMGLWAGEWENVGPVTLGSVTA